MQKKVLTEQALYYGDVAMPKDWDIDRDKLSGDILQSVIQNKDFPFSSLAQSRWISAAGIYLLAVR